MIIKQGWLNDQPGRFLAIFVFVPILIYKGYHYNDNFIIYMGFILDFMWCKSSSEITLWAYQSPKLPFTL